MCIRDSKRGSTDSLYVKASAEIKSLATFPNIKGTTIKNENLAAFSLSIPSKTATEIVAPDLEIPGIIAIAWEIPIKSEERKLTFFSVGFALSAKNSSPPVRMSINPTLIKSPSNKDSISLSKKNPANAR